MSGPGVGDTAPEFSLPRTMDESATLSALLAQGPVVLAFYPFAFGPT
jgi:peroxiredoxin